ncbi:MAG: hypothetical protein COB83_07780 [Gammaproteobacteria bacterium]|nr:MAG: hypothetical protein COB83_07780 [Gammaproteobacteria bacterium]
MIKAHLFINGYSGQYAPALSNKLHPCSVLKNRCNDEHVLLRRPQRAGLETFLIPAESCILKWFGYKLHLRQVL